MVNLENQGMMTEFDAVHGISTSELFNTKPLKFRGFFISVHFNFFFNFFTEFGLFKPFIDFLKLSNYTDS